MTGLIERDEAVRLLRAGGIVAVIIANIVAFFLVRMIGRNLEA